MRLVVVLRGFEAPLKAVERVLRVPAMEQRK